MGFLLLNSFGGYIHMGSWQQGWVCAIFFLGGVIGAYMRCAAAAAASRLRGPWQRVAASSFTFTPPGSSWMNDALGRRAPLLLAGMMVTGSALLGGLNSFPRLRVFPVSTKMVQKRLHSPRAQA